jgi:hypothetical protein
VVGVAGLGGAGVVVFGVALSVAVSVGASATGVSSGLTSEVPLTSLSFFDWGVVCSVSAFASSTVSCLLARTTETNMMATMAAIPAIRIMSDVLLSVARAFFANWTALVFKLNFISVTFSWSWQA